MSNESVCRIRFTSASLRPSTRHQIDRIGLALPFVAPVPCIDVAAIAARYFHDLSVARSLHVPFCAVVTRVKRPRLDDQEPETVVSPESGGDGHGPYARTTVTFVVPSVRRCGPHTVRLFTSGRAIATAPAHRRYRSPAPWIRSAGSVTQRRALGR